MQSGSQHSQGAAYSQFQRGSDSTVHSPQDRNVILANGLPQNMLVTQYPPVLGVAHSPVQRQQGNVQSLQNFQGHQHPCIQSRVTAPSSERTNANFELHLNKKPSQQVRGFPAALNLGQTSIQDLNRFGGILYTSPQQQFSPVSLGGPPSTDRVLPVGGILPPSDEEILTYIAKRLQYYRTVLEQEKSHAISAFHQPDCVRSDVIMACTATNGQVSEKTSSKACQTKPEAGATSVSVKCSAENPQITLAGATSCIKNEDEGPVVLPVVPGMTLDVKHSSLIFNCDSSQEVKPPLLNISKTLDDVVPGVSRVINHTRESVKGGTDLRPVEELVLDNVRGVKDISKNFQNGSCSVVSENRTFEPSSCMEQQVAEEKKTLNIKGQTHCIVANSEVPLLSNESKWLSNQVSCDVTRVDVAFVSPKTHLEKEPASLSESTGEGTSTAALLKVTQYEDISDDDTAQLGPNKELVFSAYLEEPQYEDISECEPEVSNESAPSGNEGSGNVLGQTQMRRPKTETLEITQHGPSSLCLTETDDGLKDPTLPWSFVLADADEADDLMDEDKWCVYPLTIYDLKFETEDGNIVPDDAETEDEENQPDTSPMQCEADVQTVKEIPVFDTLYSYFESVRKKGMDISFCNTPEQQMVSEEKVHALHNRSESVHEDSSGTEDSCDYSSGSEHNYLTVSRKLVHGPPEVNDSVSDEDNEVSDVRECQTASSDKLVCAEKHTPRETNTGHLKHVRKTNKQKMSKDDYVIILDSDTEDESDHKWKNNKKRKRLLSLSSEESENDTCGGHSPATSDSRVQFQKNGLPSSDSVMQDTSSDGTEMKEEPGLSSHKESIIILDSDSDDDGDRDRKKAKRKRLSSRSEDGGDAPHVQKRQSPETASKECGTAKGKLKETKLSSAGTSLPQKQPKPKDTQFKKVTQGSRSDHSQNGKKQLVGAKSGSSHVQHKTERQTMSKDSDSAKEVKKHNSSKHQANRQSKRSSEGKSNDSPAPKPKPRPSTKTVDHGTAKEKPQKPKLSSEHSTKKPPQSKSRREGSLVVPNHVVAPRQVCTNTEGSKSTKTPSKETQSFATKNKVQGNKEKHRGISRTFSLPNQSSPSGSISSSSSTSRNLSEAKRRPQQSESIPRKHGSELQRSHSNSTTSSPTKGPSSAIMIKARRQEIKQRRRRSLGVEDVKTRNLDSVKETRPRLFDDRTPRRRNSSHKSVPPLMKKTTKSAIELTKARSRDAPREQSYPVGEGYKWSEKSTGSKPAKGPSWESELEGETSTHRFRSY